MFNLESILNLKQQTDGAPRLELIQNSQSYKLYEMSACFTSAHSLLVPGEIMQCDGLSMELAGLADLLYSIL